MGLDARLHLLLVVYKKVAGRQDRDDDAQGNREAEHESRKSRNS